MNIMDRDRRPLERLAYAARASQVFARQPQEALDRAIEKVATWRDERRSRVPSVFPEWSEECFHQRIGAGLPCSKCTAFCEVWKCALDDLASRQIRYGRGSFGGWDDGDSRLVQLAWCLARHLRPERVVETGVARGLTTRTILEALDRNGDGHLWSIDLAPLLESGLADEIGTAVPKRLYARWTFLRGSTRRVLPGLVTDLHGIDLFIHDSMHTTRNVRFELESVWPALSRGGVLLIDDVERNAAMGMFAEAHPQAEVMSCASDDGKALIGCIVKTG